REPECGGEEEQRADEHDDLQRVKVAVREEANEFRQRDEDRIVGRMRLVTRHVVLAHAELEECFVPVPWRARAGEKTRRRDEDGGREEDLSLPQRERRRRLAEVVEHA